MFWYKGESFIDFFEHRSLYDTWNGHVRNVVGILDLFKIKLDKSGHVYY